MAIRNRKPNHITDLRKNATRGFGSEGNMAQIEKYPQTSKTAQSVFGMVKQQVLGSYKAAGIATSLFLASGSAFGLGLGVLDVASNLDQPLNGLITVNVAPGDDISTLQAQVASREEFEKLGIDYPEYLKDVQLDVERSGQGAVLRVSSNGVIIKEPFIHFLVKVTWSGGNFLREYTALIDPPVYAAETPKSISKPRAVGTDQSFESDVYVDDVSEDDQALTGTEYQEPVALEAEPIDEPVTEDVFDNAESVADDLAADDVTNDFTNNVGNDTASIESSEARYGPVASGESLSVIAQELQRQVPDLSIYAIMKVLFEENREAFINDNINGLLKGSILDVGDLNQIRSTDLAEARLFFQQQVSEWDPNVLVANDNNSGIGVGQDTYTSDSDLFGNDTSSSFGDTSIGDNFQVGASNDTETFLSAGQGNSSEGEVLALKQEISQLQTSLASSELENQELSERILLLEGQLEDMNRIISLDVENTDLAALESTLATQNDANDASISDPASDAINEFLTDDGVTADETASDVATSTDDLLNEFLDDSSADGETTSSDDALLGSDTIASDTLADSGFDSTLDSTDSLATDDGIDSVSDTQSVIEEVVNEPAAPVTTPAINRPADSGSFFDKIGGLLPALGGLGALLLGGLGLFLWRRRRADEEFEISMLSIESNSQSIDIDTETGLSASMSASVTDSTVGGGESEEDDTADKETSFLTVYSDSDAVVQADEVDPIAEADVYIAYGRDEQAEEVLLDGIAAHPDRVDVKHKLIGLYFKNKNVEGFERIAEELYAQRDSMAGDEWQEISDMGKELVPENPLFALSGIDFDVVEQVSENVVEAGAADVENDSAASAEPVAGSDSEDDDLLVFDTVDETSESEMMTMSVTDGDSEADESDLSEMIVDSLNDDPSIQLINFDDGRSEISELDEVEIGALAVEEGDDGVLEFNSPVSELSSDDDMLAVDLSDNSDSLAGVDLNDTGSVEDDLNSDDLVFDFDVDSKGDVDDLAAELESDDEQDFGEEKRFSEVPEVSDLVIDPEYDEAQTQYELAKVFVDLGDDDGARKILQDLVANADNSDELIANSQELLDSINT